MNRRWRPEQLLGAGCAGRSTPGGESMKQTRFFPRAGERLRLGEDPAGHSIFANEVDELALNADPVGAENARLIGRIGGF